jgi:hypothetical protein
MAVPRLSWALLRAPVTACTVSGGAPTERRKLATSAISACCPNTPSSATPSSSAGNSDISE